MAIKPIARNITPAGMASSSNQERLESTVVYMSLKTIARQLFESQSLQDSHAKWTAFRMFQNLPDATKFMIYLKINEIMSSRSSLPWLDRIWSKLESQNSSLQPEKVSRQLRNHPIVRIHAIYNYLGRPLNVQSKKAGNILKTSEANNNSKAMPIASSKQSIDPRKISEANKQNPLATSKALATLSLFLNEEGLKTAYKLMDLKKPRSAEELVAEALKLNPLGLASVDDMVKSLKGVESIIEKKEKALNPISPTNKSKHKQTFEEPLETRPNVDIDVEIPQDDIQESELSDNNLFQIPPPDFTKLREEVGKISENEDEESFLNGV